MAVGNQVGEGVEERTLGRSKLSSSTILGIPRVKLRDVGRTEIKPSKRFSSLPLARLMSWPCPI